MQKKSLKKMSLFNLRYYFFTLVLILEIGNIMKKTIHVFIMYANMMTLRDPRLLIGLCESYPSAVVWSEILIMFSWLMYPSNAYNLLSLSAFVSLFDEI